MFQTNIVETEMFQTNIVETEMFQTNTVETEMFQKNAVQKIKTHILCSTTSFQKPFIDKIMWKNVEKPDRSQMTI